MDRIGYDTHIRDAHRLRAGAVDQFVSQLLRALVRTVRRVARSVLPASGPLRRPTPGASY